MKHIMKINRNVECDGTSIYSNTLGRKLRVSHIVFEEDAADWPIMYIWVHHNGAWTIYTDSGFEKNISKIVSDKIGTPVKIIFTEQGMQRNKVASMEFKYAQCEKNLRTYFRGKTK